MRFPPGGDLSGGKMKTEWDYTNMADAYLERPDYSPDALGRIFGISGVKAGDKACDVGAGVAHLTIPLAEYGLKVDVVEPNDDMRRNGIARTKPYENVSWREGIGEATGLPGNEYDLVSFGSSFSVCDRQKALQETARLLKPGKYFVCLWNHRDLEDPIQKNIEAIIKKHIPDYDYGTRRQDQTKEIAKSGMFEPAEFVEGNVVWRQPVEKVVEAWRSHATLKRQAGDKLPQIIAEIEAYLNGLNLPEIEIPYTTRAWLARKK